MVRENPPQYIASDYILRQQPDENSMPSVEGDTSETKFRYLMDTAPVMIWVMGTDKLCTFFNQPWLVFTGRTMEQELGTGWYEGVHPEDLANCHDIELSYVDRRKPFQLEYRLRRADGEYRWILDNGVPHFASDGRFLGYIGSCIDVTDRKHAEAQVRERAEALRRSETYLAEGQRLTHTGSWAWNPATNKVLHWSDEMFRIVGLDPQNGVPDRQTFWQTCVHPEDRDRTYAQIQSSVSDKIDFLVELRIVLPDGTVRHIESLGHPVLNSAGEVIEYIGTALDVTERKHAERQLREAETRFRTYVDHATDALFVHVRGESAKIFDVNRQACDSLGYKREELIGMTPLDFDRGVDKAFLQRLGARIEAGETVTFETSHQRKDGTVFPVEVRVRPFLHEGRQLALSLARDITERKHAEQERERLRELEAELVRMNRVTMMGELAASLAHEIKQPIAGATMSARACLQWLQRETPEIERALQSASRMLNDVRRATDIVDRNSSLYRRTTTEREPVYANEIIRQMVVMLQDAAFRHSVSVRTELDPELPITTADRVQLQQVLMNLMLNGIEAMKDRRRSITNLGE
jgi:PAS domain S-box-containing protein